MNRGFLVIFLYFVQFVLNSFQGIARQWSRGKCAHMLGGLHSLGCHGYLQGDAAFALQVLIPLKHPLPISFCRRVETKKKIKKPELTSFLIAFGNKSPVFPNEKGITRTKLPSMPVINILHVP